ncbi:MAG: molybdopterin converting factor subunit 1 [Deltaproteobacteria bacterium]|nr:molybdopterin converting factor subunit 1 [Deltaproteobacteria bacterium]
MIRLLYFAAVRDLVGKSEEELALPAGVATVGALAAHLTGVHPSLAGRLSAVRFARNEEFARDEDPVADGDVIALIPPVAGG